MKNKKNNFFTMLLIVFGVCINTVLAESTQTSETITSYQDTSDSGLIIDVLWKVIAREGKSKKYTDLIPLDGGTVGIAHFAVGGLAELYEHMDTQTYFGKSQKEMADNYSSNCRPAGKKGNDTGWGCYSQSWWKQGMTNFINSPGSKTVQNKAWSLKMKPVIEDVIAKGWTTQRQIAIALGIANSVGNGGFNKLVSKNGWDAEKTLKAYAGSDKHRQRREEAINTHFPKK